MNFSSIINSPLLDLLTVFVPQAKPVLAIIHNYAPAITAAEPVIRAAIAEGKPAYEAAKQKAPQLVSAVQELFTHLPHLGSNTHKAVQFENITRGLVGYHKLTPEEEKVWMDRATPHNDPSQENSNVGSG